MARSSEKKMRLIDAAKQLIHQQGYGRTTLADIAEEAGVPLGNVYYYFKTKEEIGAAVIDERRESFLRLFEKLEQRPDPRQRLKDYIDAMHSHRKETVKYGCPVGSLCQELTKINAMLSNKVDAIVELQLSWVTDQFKQMGKKDAQECGLHMITTLHGASLVSNALKKEKVMTQQAQRLQTWLKGI